MARSLRALDVGGGPPLPFNVARSLLSGSSIEFTACEAGGCAAQWTGEDEEPYVPDAEWSDDERAAIATLAEVVYGYIGSVLGYRAHPPTDWSTYFD